MPEYESHQDDYEPDGETQDVPPQQDEDAEVSGDSGDSEESGAAAQFQHKPEDDEVAEIEKEREERLDPDNRPDGAEVDNTQRDFDVERGMYTDSEGYEAAPERFPPSAEQDA